MLTIMKQVLAIIPARGGSTRIPNKNIKLFLRKPILYYPIQTALMSKCFSTIMVSTDNNEIAKLAQKFGASAPFFRSIQNASNSATLADVIIEVIESYKQKGQHFDGICCILPTAVFLTIKMLKQTSLMFEKVEVDAVIPVCQYSYPIERALIIQQGKLRMKNPQNERVRTQDINLSYHDAGLFYWIKTSVILKTKRLFVPNTLPFEIPEQLIQDIDNPIDWPLAEIKYLNSKKLGKHL